MSLRCEHCHFSLAPTSILDSATYAITPQWFGFKCINCNCGGYFSIQDSLLQIAIPDGFPGPVFIVKSQLLVAGLNIESSVRDGIVVSLNGKTWSVPSWPPTKQGLLSRALKWLKGA